MKKKNRYGRGKDQEKRKTSDKYRKNQDRNNQS